ncbi:hypothetical protein [Inquilinus limosus]|uniref:hypothetical protein n=1 Tax=Inquilinus limosus TaxID=171674 RepID=UPI00041DB7AA|nr:hypothetical protein [Inquilinus limosus]
MPRPCQPLFLRAAVAAALIPAAAPAARAWPDPGPAGEASQVQGFIPDTGIIFDIPADPQLGPAWRWDGPDTAPRAPMGLSAYAAPDQDHSVVTGQRDPTGAGSVGAALQAQSSGFIAKTGVTFDIPADPYPGFAQRWNRLEMARRSASGKAEASVGLTQLPWFVPFFSSARIEASFDPQAGEGTGQVAAVLSSSWSLVGLTASSENRYVVSQGGLLGPEAPVTSWEIDRTTRVELPWHTTALLLGSQYTSTERHLTGSVGAEQTVFGPLKVSASLVDLGTDQPGAKFTAGISFNW